MRLVDGRFSRRLEVIPISVVSASRTMTLSAHRAWSAFSQPFNQWILDVSLANDSSFFSRTPSAGEILAEVRLTGARSNVPVHLDKLN